MKLNYITPYIAVEDLERADVLLASGEASSDPVVPSKKERENAYRDIMDFIGSGPGAWF